MLVEQITVTDIGMVKITARRVNLYQYIIIIIISIALYYNYSKRFNNVIENYYHFVNKINSCKLFQTEMFSIAF